MNVELIKKAVLEDFALKHPNSRKCIVEWFAKLRYADWSRPDDIRRTFKSADLLGNGANRVVFDIGGNNYRMIATYFFDENCIHLVMKWMGTHAEYDKLCKKRKQFFVDDF